jgi:hypothetical protein
VLSVSEEHAACIFRVEMANSESVRVICTGNRSDARDGKRRQRLILGLRDACIFNQNIYQLVTLALKMEASFITKRWYHSPLLHTSNTHKQINKISKTASCQDVWIQSVRLVDSNRYERIS